MPNPLSDARNGHPQTVLGKALLCLVAIAQIVVSIALLPIAAAWYGLHEMPDWLSESIRPAAKTIWNRKSGPYRGCVW